MATLPTNGSHAPAADLTSGGVVKRGPGEADFGPLQVIMDQASEALVNRRYFQAERLANRALHDAWVAQEYELVARICMPLQEARRQRRLLAVDTGRVVVCDGALPAAQGAIEAGCYIIAPPNVGIDARRLAESAFEQETPVIAIAHEPRTQLGRLPLVAVGPTTIRTQVRPPAEFTVTWCLEAIEALEQQALAQIDEGRPLDRQIDDVVDMLDTIPESEALHITLAQLARQLSRSNSAGR